MGTTNALKEIQLDRYSAVSPEGVSVAFLDTQQQQKGWKATVTAQDAWVRYNRVDFGDKPLHSVRINASSSTGGTIAIRVDAIDGPLIAQVEVAQNTDWSIVSSPLSEIPSGIHDLVVALTDAKNVEIDWIRFE